MAAILNWLQSRTMLAAILAAGFLSGLLVWKFQEARLDALQAQFDSFVGQAKAEGEAAQKVADMRAKQANQAKETSDNEYQSQLDALRADNQRMRNDRASRNILPAAPAGSRDPETVCFDRAKFEQAVQRLDDGISKLIGAGDEDAEGLNVAKRWAKSLQ